MHIFGILHLLYKVVSRSHTTFSFIIGQEKRVWLLYIRNSFLMNLQNLGIVDWHKEVLIFCAQGELLHNLRVSSCATFLAA